MGAKIKVKHAQAKLRLSRHTLKIYWSHVWKEAFNLVWIWTGRMNSLLGDSCFTDNCTAPLIRSPCEQCRPVLCMHSPTSFSRALLWKNNEILWMSSDFNHCLDTRVNNTEEQRGITFYVASENMDLFIVLARISQLLMYEGNINTADFRGTGTDYSLQYKLSRNNTSFSFNSQLGNKFLLYM